MNRTTILLLFGGESSEHEVSISSARNVYAAIDDTNYTVLLGYIDRQGKWWLIDEFNERVDSHGAPQLMPALGAGSFVTMPGNRIVSPDVILPILHGKNGEDGSVQGLAQLLHIPIVGCNVTASAICMDKVATKEILRANSLTVVPYVVHRSGDAAPDFNHLSMQLGSPMFVKPVHAGSSVGVSKIYSEEELTKALTVAYEHDASVLIERGISGRELEVAVLGNPPHHQVSDICEVKLKEGFYDYETKYAATSTAELTIPADLPESTKERIRQLAGKAYSIVGGTGLARVDFFLADDDTVYINEINTMPGFTNLSVYPKQWRNEGISYSDLIERLISLALHDTIKPKEMEEQWKAF
ncbi:MAG TPA: D-alanine--D-alanine ligase family protein [Candidatus Saccharimonadales bacterium]|nr:D-alanine--D-alanine ligase family protein [Candidatus Saccharimonadales bacterium]